MRSFHRMTLALFAMSDFMVAYWYTGPVFLAAIVLSIRQYGTTPQGRYNLDSIKLKVPITGDLTLKIAVSRFARTFGVLIAAGVPIMRTMEIIGETSGNAVITKAINDSRNAIRDGQRLSTPLTDSGLFPPMVTHMIDIGEETGRLELRGVAEVDRL